MFLWIETFSTEHVCSFFFFYKGVTTAFRKLILFLLSRRPLLFISASIWQPMVIKKNILLCQFSQSLVKIKSLICTNHSVTSPQCWQMQIIIKNINKASVANRSCNSYALTMLIFPSSSCCTPLVKALFSFAF